MTKVVIFAKMVMPYGMRFSRSSDLFVLSLSFLSSLKKAENNIVLPAVNRCQCIESLMAIFF
jgi:hypothetical protein